MSAISSSDASSKMSATAAKSTKASKTAATTPVVAAPVVAAPAAETKTKGSKKAAATTVAAAPAPAVAAPVTAPVEAAAPVAEDDIVTKLTKAVTRAAEIAHQQKALATEAAANAKEIEKLSARLAKKAGGKKKRASGGGDAFKKPIPVTNELAAFLGLEKGASISRSEVTKRFFAYLKAHNLQKGKVIHTDASVRKLLGVKETDEITIMNLQTFLNPHYIKAAPAAN